MFKRTKLRNAIAATAVLAVSLTAGAGIAGAAGNAETKVTIKQQSGDFYGKVKSSDPYRCADDRKVVLYEQLGSGQDHRNDRKVASDRSSLDGDHGEWSTGNTGLDSGRYYARAGKTDGCKADTSKTVRI